MGYVQDPEAGVFQGVSCFLSTVLTSRPLSVCVLGVQSCAGFLAHIKLLLMGSVPLDVTDTLFLGNAAGDVRGVVDPDRSYVLWKWHPVAKLVGHRPATCSSLRSRCPDTRAPVLSFDRGVCITCDTIQRLPALCFLSVCAAFLCLYMSSSLLVGV